MQAHFTEHFSDLNQWFPNPWTISYKSNSMLPSPPSRQFNGKFHSDRRSGFDCVSAIGLAINPTRPGAIYNLESRALKLHRSGSLKV